MLWGETQFRQSIIVNREGFVFIPEIGQVFVNGLNLNLLESKLFRVLSQAYSSLDPKIRIPQLFSILVWVNCVHQDSSFRRVSQPGYYIAVPQLLYFHLYITLKGLQHQVP